MDSKQSTALIFAGVATTGLLLAYMIKSKQQAKKKQTLYERLGGEAAVDAAVDKFYARMMADPRVNYFFKDTNMSKQHLKQKNFLSFAFGAPKKYAGLAMDKAHRKLVQEQGMNDTHFDAVAQNLDITLQELGISSELRDEVGAAVESLREQVMCRGKWAIDADAPPKASLYDRLGGEAAVNAAVDKFYARMMADPRVNYFFKDTNMAKQHLKQKNFLSFAFGAPKKYAGLAMDKAHLKLVQEQGMNDTHFDAVAQNLDITLEELGISRELRKEVGSAVEGLREQVMCRGKWAPAEEKPKASLYDRLGGEAAVDAAVDKFYARMMADPRVNYFFKDTNMAKQHLKQKNFLSFAFGAPKKYAGLAMDKAHRKLVKEQGMNDTHFDAVAQNLDITLQELGISKELRSEVGAAVESLREQVMCRGQWAN